jgi:hypothetical protein
VTERGIKLSSDRAHLANSRDPAVKVVEGTAEWTTGVRTARGKGVPQHSTAIGAKSNVMVSFVIEHQNGACIGCHQCNESRSRFTSKISEG